MTPSEPSTPARSGAVRHTRQLSIDLLESIRRIRRRTRRLSRQVLLPATPAQSEVLIVVEERPGIGITEAAAALGLATNTVSTLVSELVSLGLLDRTTAGDDRRVRRLNLTRSARAAIEAGRDMRAEAIATALDTLSSKDRAALRDAVDPLRRLADAVAE